MAIASAPNPKIRASVLGLHRDTSPEAAFTVERLIAFAAKGNYTLSNDDAETIIAGSHKGETVKSAVIDFLEAFVGSAGSLYEIEE